MPLPSPILVTAGPTWEPIDSVRFIGNRSSGRMGVSIALAAREAGHDVILALGPVTITPPESGPRLRIERFRSTADLQALLERLWPAEANTLIMAAAVADYRPTKGGGEGKIRREEGGLTLHLEPTPDLVAGCVARRRPGQVIVGFALEPAGGLIDVATAKLRRKGLDAIVANPLETMDAEDVTGTLIRADGQCDSPDNPLDKMAFARWLVATLEASRPDESRPTATPV